MEDNLDRGGEGHLFGRVLSFGIKTEIAKNILDSYENHDYIARHIDGLEIAFKKGNVKSAAAWLNTSLANNWDHSSVGSLSKKTVFRTDIKKPDEKTNKHIGDLISSSPVISTEDRALAYSKFEALAENLKTDLINQFLDSSNGFVRSEYAKKKLKSSVFLIGFKHWLVLESQILGG